MMVNANIRQSYTLEKNQSWKTNKQKETFPQKGWKKEAKFTLIQ